MQLASFPRPLNLPALAPRPAIDLARDTVMLDGSAGRTAPKEIESGIHLPIRTTALDEYGEPIDGWYAAASQTYRPYRMERTGFAEALAAAQLLSKEHEAVAVVQAARTGERYLVPLGVWNPADESELTFGDVGGTPYFNSGTDHMLLRNDRRTDVEAVVFREGAGWLNLTGHYMRLPVKPAETARPA